MDRIDQLLDDAKATIDRLDDDERPATARRAFNQLHACLVEIKREIDHVKSGKS